MGGNKKILAVVRGNHDNRVNKAVGLDPVRWACELADINYCGAEAFISFGVGDWNYDREKNRSSIKYLMFMTHGVGGGRGVGGKVNALMRHNNIIAADLFVQGHTHTPTVVPNTVYVADNRHENIIEKDQMYITTCGFIGRDGYAKDFCYNPVSQKFPVIRLGGHRRKIEAEILDFG
jgi:hypothetical protein